MTIQPCPDCGTIMSDCYDPTNQNQNELCYSCLNCGNTWTPDEILIAYELNEMMDENTPHPDEGIRE